MVNTVRTVNGIASMTVGNIDTRATNHACRRNSRHAHGGRNIWTKVSNDIAKKSPTERTGFARASVVTTTHFSDAQCLFACTADSLRGPECWTLSTYL